MKFPSSALLCFLAYFADTVRAGPAGTRTTKTATSNPNAVCAADFTLDANHLCQAPVTVCQINKNGSSDPTTTTISPTLLTGTAQTPVTLTVKGKYGVKTCSTRVTLIDNITPVITCPTPQELTTDPSKCTANTTRFAPATATDNCALAAIGVTGGPTAPVLPLGVSWYNFQVSDTSSNAASCTAIVTVKDKEKPTFTCPASTTLVINGGKSCSKSVPDSFKPTGLGDNCPGIPTWTRSPPSNTVPYGTTVYNFTVTDANGNSGTCAPTITVAQNPVAKCTKKNGVYTIGLGMNCNPGGSFTYELTDGGGFKYSFSSPLASGTQFKYDKQSGTITDASRVDMATTPMTLKGKASRPTLKVTAADGRVDTVTCPSSEGGHRELRDFEE